MEPTVEWLVRYEVRSSKRYRRRMSIALIASTASSNGFLHRYLSDAFRDSDQVFRRNGHTCVIMGETDREGCVKAMRRCRQKLNDPSFCCGVVTFPEDGHHMAFLMNEVEQRLSRATQGEEEGVVAHRGQV